MRMIVIGIAVLLMVAGATVGVLKQLEMGPFAPAANGEQAEDGLPLEPPRFVEVEPLVIPIFAGDNVATAIQIQVKLETTGAENEDKLLRIMPRLGDAFLSELYSYVPRLLREEGPLNVFAIKKRLQMVGDKVAGKGTIDNVLIQSVSDRARP